MIHCKYQNVIVCMLQISDFGMLRVINNSDSEVYYFTSGGNIPLKWTAPEVLTFHHACPNSHVF